MDKRDYYQLFYCGKVHYIEYKTGKEIKNTEEMMLETYVLDYKESTNQSNWKRITVILKNVSLYYDGAKDETTIIVVSGIEYEIKVSYYGFKELHNEAIKMSLLPMLN